MKKLFARLMMTAVMLFAASMVEAQRMGDDTYVVLGHGYAKDSENVYLNGQVLPWVDPHTFSLKRCDGHQSHRCFEKYVISHSDVFYDGKKLDDASAYSFKDLGYGYGKDSFDVYFCGKKISGASANSFRLLKDGYAKDAFDVYFYGKKVSDASASSFSVDENGYAHDTFSTYYFGKKIGD